MCRGGRQTDGWLCLYVNLSSAFLVNSYLEEPFLKTLLSFGLLLVLCLKANAVNTTLPEVVVTATRTAQTVDESLASVTVITRDDIDNSQALSVPEILRTVPGLDVSTNGGLGQTTSLFMRGTESDHILVLVDGVKIGSATTSGVPFEHLPLSQVERIEIVRGPRSSLYGSEAIGGVIQIFTRRGKGPLRTEASIGWGDDSTGKIMAGISGSQQDTWYSLYADRLQTDGFNACQGSTSSGCFTIEPDDDGYDNTAFSAKLGHRFGKQGSVEVHALQARGNSQYDSSMDNEADFVQEVLGFKADYFVGSQWQMNLKVGKSRDEADHFGNKSAESYFHTDRLTGSFQNDFFFSNDRILTLGMDYQKDDVESSTIYNLDSLDNQGFFAAFQTQFDAVDLNVGFRRDDNEQFGDHTTGNIGLSYALSRNTRFIASYGTAFKAPSFNELYYPNFGNPKLSPEESKSTEIGLKGKQAHYRWSLNAYQTQIDKLIATQFDAATGNYFADNINQAKIKGLDASLRWHKKGWEWNTNLSWLKPEDETTDHLLPRRAEKTFSMELAERRGPARLGIGVLAQSYRYEDAANTQRLSGYGILNTNYEHRLNKYWAFRLHVENVLDKQYETARFYNTQGRFWFLSLHYNK
ncbi:MAG: TonB-dependent vitamin B12 receptor [Candidatus Parabeggiatoa sp. nov. 3]|nr:MAG: TonB-dependent vitamin B12 receptor [Gammaproteobacteria bacterium]RKZ83523.1 MAG: TonB-dependent vitamin B12 receptor [Gammaproteobacteria bacterium]